MRPRPAIACGAFPSIRSPRNRISPRSGRWKPEITLKSVVLPAPFGPIRAVIEPCPTSSVAPSSAAMPPKCFTTPSTARIFAPLLKDHLLALAEDALWAERHQPDEDEPDHDEAQVRPLGRVEVGKRGKVEEARARENQAEDKGPHRNAP